MRIAGVFLIIFGFLISLSIVGAFVGIPMMIIGFVMVIMGGRRKTIITNVVQVSNNGGAPSMSFQDDDDRRRQQPVLRSRMQEPPIMPPPRVPAQISRAPEYEAAYDDEPFTDVRTQLTQDARRILALAKEDGFEIKARPTSLTVRKGEYEEVFRSNEEIHEFGLSRGYQ